MKEILLKTFIISTLLFFNNSCRVDIIEPNNPAGNKNLPIREEKENYFNVVINADRLSTEMNFDMNFSSEFNSISLKVYDKQSGTCTLRVISSNNITLYSAVIEANDINISQRINQGIPSKIRFICNNFTGKIKIVISKSLL